MARRPPHDPERTCVVCRTKRPKRELTRVVRVPDGEVRLDPDGGSNGRGAYVCPDRDHWDDPTTGRRLAHALKSPVGDQVIAELAKQTG